MLIPFPQGSEDLGTTCYENATLVSATFEEAHTEGNLPWDEYRVPDTWKTVVRINGKKITSDSRAVYNSIVAQNGTEVTVKVAKKKAYYKIALFEKHWDYEYSLVE